MMRQARRPTTGPMRSGVALAVHATGDRAVGRPTAATVQEQPAPDETAPARARIAVENPATGEVVGHVPDLGP